MINKLNSTKSRESICETRMTRLNNGRVPPRDRLLELDHEYGGK